MRLLVVEVIEQAVDEDHVGRFDRARREARDVRDAEVAAMAAARVGNVSVVDVDARIVDVSEVVGVRARPAADIEDTADPRQIVLRKERAQLGFRKRRLPRAVRPRVIHQIGDPHASLLQGRMGRWSAHCPRYIANNTSGYDGGRLEDAGETDRPSRGARRGARDDVAQLCVHFAMGAHRPARFTGRRSRCSLGCSFSPPRWR